MGIAKRIFGGRGGDGESGESDGGGAADPRRAPLRITIYARAACHLCDAMLDDLRYQLAHRLARGEVLIDAIDIDSDPGLVARFGDRVPALFVAGEAVCDYRIDRQMLELALRAHLPPAGPHRR
jgi:hypothetical protein